MISDDNWPLDDCTDQINESQSYHERIHFGALLFVSNKAPEQEKI